LLDLQAARMLSSGISRDRQAGRQGLRDARHGFDQASNIYSFNQHNAHPAASACSIM
jgi:hypothetical protein